MRKHQRRWIVKNRSKQMLRFLAERVERMYMRGVPFAVAMDSVTRNLH